MTQDNSRPPAEVHNDILGTHKARQPPAEHAGGWRFLL
jgi:hypothetical protein